MAKTKGGNIVFEREFLRKHGKETEQAFLEKLNAEEINIYQKTLPISWVPIEAAAKIFEMTAATLYPGDAQGLQYLGRAQAYDHLTGIYRIILRITTIPFLIEKTAKLWKNYHDQGRAWSGVGRNKNSAFMIVEDYPDLPETFREMLCGYIAGCMELTGARNVRVTRDNNNPDAWKWNIFWK
ncbi:hypothetical protein KAR34_08210 [bacterium]|nr:hypothetical protein [bacterium]